jgi:hypothetical protein
MLGENADKDTTRRISRKEGKVTGRGKSRNEKLHNLHSSLNACYRDIDKEVEVGGKCLLYGRYEKCIQNLIKKPERKRTFWRPKSR